MEIYSKQQTNIEISVNSKTNSSVVN